jgi:hypothetical protein
MALFQEEFNNKLEFYDISKFNFTFSNANRIYDVTSSIFPLQLKKMFVGGDSTTTITIPNGASRYNISNLKRRFICLYF